MSAGYGEEASGPPAACREMVSDGGHYCTCLKEPAQNHRKSTRQLAQSQGAPAFFPDSYFVFVPAQLIVCEMWVMTITFG